MNLLRKEVKLKTIISRHITEVIQIYPLMKTMKRISHSELSQYSNL